MPSSGDTEAAEAYAPNPEEITMNDAKRTTASEMPSGIKGLHHNAYRCRDSEETRRFYEDFLGMRLAGVLEIEETKTDRSVNALHTFFEMQNGSYLAFFEVPDSPYDFHDWHDYDLHIALEVDYNHMLAMKAKGEAAGMDVRGVADHHFIHSIYFRDPNGYVIELTARLDNHDITMDPTCNEARTKLDGWQAAKVN